MLTSLADYGAQALVVVAVAAVANASDTLPTALIAVICSFWCFGTFAATLRQADSIRGTFRPGWGGRCAG